MRLMLACGLGILLIAGVAPGTAAPGGDDQAKLKGKWRAELDGKKITFDFTKDGFTFDLDGMVFKGTVNVDPKKKPREMDLTISDGPNPQYNGKTALSIYEID